MRAKSLFVISILILGQLLILASVSADEEYPKEIHILDDVMSYESIVLIPPGEDFTVTFDPSNSRLIPKREPQLELECQQALDLVPQWMKLNLTHKFRLLPRDERVLFANLIRNSPNESYRDEIGFVIAHSTPETLMDSNFFPQLITHNARLIYENDPYLDYVKVVEKEDYTTLSYRQADHSWVELSKDDYYWFVVHPKLGDELPTYVDPDYDYTSDPPFDRNSGVPPPTGKYWREWFFEYNKTGKPLLLDRLKGKNTTLDAIKAINGWIDSSMIFTSDNERPVQPVRIYVKGQGRCGEYQDMRSAAARAALIPVIATSNAAEDHVWNEFWDLGWHHWDGMIDNPHAYEKGWGKTLSSVWNSRGDGYSWSVTSTYSETANFNFLVRDLAGQPVDGAEIEVFTENFYQPEIKTETFGTVTDSTGRVSFALGDLRNYWGRADTTDLGSDPTNPLTQNEIALNTTAGEEYNVLFRLSQSAPRLQTIPPGPGGIQTSPNDPYFNIDFEVIGQITRGDASVAPGRYDLYKGGGNIDFFMADRVNTASYKNEMPFIGHNVQERTSNYSLHRQVPADDQWIYVLSNGFSQQTYKVIKLNVTVTKEYSLSIDTPIQNQRVSVGSEFDISGTVFTDQKLYGVEFLLNDMDGWRPVSNYTDIGNGSQSWTESLLISKFMIPPDSKLPLDYTVMARLKDNNRSIVSSKFLLVDDVYPSISVRLDKNSVPQGGAITVNGEITDNFAVGAAYYAIDSSSLSSSRRLELLDNSQFALELSTAGLGAGPHEIWIFAEDLYENSIAVARSFEVIEGEPPKIEIFQPTENTILKHGDPIEIRGRVRDNVGVQKLSISIGGRDPKEIDIGQIDDQGYFSYSFAYSSSTIREGYQELELSANDGVGNTATESLLLILDGEKPTIELDTPDMITVSPTTDLEITGTLSDDHGIGGIEVMVNGRSGPKARLSTVSGIFSLSLDANFDLHEGDNTVALRGYDSVGWMTDEEIIVSVDGTPPAIRFDNPPSHIMKGQELDIRILIEEDNEISDVVILLPGSGAQDITEYLDVAEIDVTLDTSRMRTGLSDITVQVRDAAENLGEASFSINVITETLDSDNDGIPDWWEYKYNMDPFTFDSDQDPDFDGYTNLEEFLGNDRFWGDVDDSTDPRDNLSHPDPTGVGRSVALLYILVLTVVFAVIVLIILGIIFTRKRPLQKTS